MTRLTNGARHRVFTEVWSSAEAPAASLQDEATRATFQRAMPLIAGVE